jgi:hypothetical protein
MTRSGKLRTRDLTSCRHRPIYNVRYPEYVSLERGWTIFASLLLANLILAGHSDFAQSAGILIPPHAPGVSYTHGVFRGSDNHYLVAPFATNEIKGRSDFPGNVTGPDRAQFSWKYKIVATVFWVGEPPAVGNPVSNSESAWDPAWIMHYGGEDDPLFRVNFLPLGFIPKQNPFYVALPYNDVEEDHTRSEAATVIPWFNSAFVRDGQSVCKGRWVAIRHGRRICYAQWEDVGPFQADHWQYVFGPERPRTNANHDAGIDVSPAVRDYLGMSSIDVCDWKFVSVWEVPIGPWTLYGDDNTVAHLRRQLRPLSRYKGKAKAGLESVARSAP